MNKDEAAKIVKDWFLNKLYWSNKNITPIPYEVILAMSTLTEEELEKINKEIKDLWD